MSTIIKTIAKGTIFIGLIIVMIALSAVAKAETLAERNVPLSTSAANSHGIRGMALFNAGDFIATGTIKYIDMVVAGSNPAVVLAPEFPIGSETCRADSTKTGTDFGLTANIPKRVTFEMTPLVAGGCDIDSGTAPVTMDLTVGAGSGYTQKSSSTSTSAYIAYTQGGIAPSVAISSGFHSTYNTRFTALDITGSSTINVYAEYLLDLSEVDYTQATRNPTLVWFGYAKRPDTEFSAVGESINNTIGGSNDVDTDLSGLADGTYDLLVRFANQGSSFSGIYPFENAYVYTDFTIAGGVLVATGTIEFYDSTTFIDEWSAEPCSITQIGGCISNALHTAFVPTTAQLANFNDFQEEVPNRVPFNWYYEISETLTTTEMSSSTFDAYTLNVPFLGAEFEILSEDLFDEFVGSTAIQLFRTLMVIGLYLSFLIMVFFTIQGMFNKTDDGLKQ